MKRCFTGASAILFCALARLTLFLVVIATAANAANLTPVAVTGFNRDVIVENTSVGPPYTTARNFNYQENTAYYESGLPGRAYGLPVSGAFMSALGDGTQFQLQSFTASNALILSSDTALNSGTLTLSSPAMYSRIAIIANSGSADGDTANVTLTFNDGSTFVTTYNAPDWFFRTANVALQGFGRVNLSTGVPEGGPNEPRFYQTTLNLYALGATNRPLTSLRFFKVGGLTRSTGIYAVSGLPTSAVTLPVVTNAPARNIQADSATLGGQVISTGDEPPSITIFYGPIDGGSIPGAWANSVTLGRQNGAFAQDITSLTPDTPYYFRIRAVNAAGAAWAASSFTFTPVTGGLSARSGPGLALRFDGVDDYVEAPSYSGLEVSNRITLEAWVYPQNGGTIVSRGHGGDGSITDYILQLVDFGAGIKVGFFAAGDWDYSVGSLPVNAWTHVAVTYDGTNKRFYIDGSLDSTSMRAGTIYSSGSPVYVGRQGSVCNCNLFKGQIDELRIWNTVRTSSEISQNARRSLKGSESGLLAYFRFDETYGIAAEDASVYGNTGILNNRPVPVPSTVPFAPLVIVNGANLATNECHTSFTDPGAVSRDLPVTVTLAAGFQHASALKFDGHVVGWGAGTYLQNLSPAAAAYIAVACGYEHTIVLQTNGVVSAWGRNDYSQVVLPPSATNVVAIAAGAHHNLALKADGTVIAWGKNTSGQINVPPSATNLVGVAAGDGFSLALRSDGTVLNWGASLNIPPGITNVVKLAAGAFHSLALTKDGTVLAWGANDRGQLDVPASATNVMGISAGAYHSLAIKKDGAVLGWGFNHAGQIVPPAMATGLVAIAAGGFYSLGLRVDGTVLGWGENAFHITEIPPGVNATDLSASVDGTVDTNLPGFYSLSYRATNALDVGGVAVRTVVVKDTGPPTITLLGPNPLLHAVRNPWVDPGASAADACAGNLTANILVRGAVNTNVPGVYPLTYTVTDPSGNSATNNRLVVVVVSGDMNGDGIVDQNELNAVLSNYYPTSPWLYMTNVAGLGGTNVVFSLTNSTAGAFSVEYTTNLMDWLYLGPATPRYEFIDRSAPPIPQRYYRLRWP
jgi:hypothetical protein